MEIEVTFQKWLKTYVFEVVILSMFENEKEEALFYTLIGVSRNEWEASRKTCLIKEGTGPGRQVMPPFLKLKAECSETMKCFLMDS